MGTALTIAPMAIAASGIASATARFGAAAGQLVRVTSSNTPSDTAQPIVDMIEARTAFTANVAAFKAGDKMMGSLLDILA